MRCLYCDTELEGRRDKKYCSPHCKSSYHYEKKCATEPSFYEKVDHQLKQNRKILKMYNKAGLSTVKKSILIGEGFNPNYFTHYWKNKKGDIYLFCYEFGFFNPKGEDKYVLVKWQSYMG